MKRLLGILLCLSFPFVSWALDYALVDETSWNVGSYENGAKGPFHPVPWRFHSDKTVNAGNLWKGIWQVERGNRMKVMIMHQDSATDIFEVDFINATEFIAFKNGQPYRWGQRR
jgi:hypothetical protein